jgi:methyltransferase (TIGR00027 family)
VKEEQASGTALLIAASLVLLHHDPKYSRAVSKNSADFSARVLGLHSARARLFVKASRQTWFRTLAKLVEQMTIPGILLHYALRKKCIAALARAALADGATQVVTIGAGLDPLSFQLREEFPSPRLWEIDHPATQREKSRAWTEYDTQAPEFLPIDLSASALDANALIANGFDPTHRTFWIAEGLLMYLRAEIVSSLMTTLHGLSSAGSEFTFTFMEKQNDHSIRFQEQSRLVDWWLRWRGEPFRWGARRSELAELVRPWKITRFFDHDDLRALEPALAGEPLAKGEVICLAEVPRVPSNSARC